MVRTIIVYYWKDLETLDMDGLHEPHSISEIAAFALLDFQENQIGGWKSTSAAIDDRKWHETRKVPIGHEIVGFKCNKLHDDEKEWITDLSFVLWSPPKEMTSMVD